MITTALTVDEERSSETLTDYIDFFKYLCNFVVNEEAMLVLQFNFNFFKFFSFSPGQLKNEHGFLVDEHGKLKEQVLVHRDSDGKTRDQHGNLRDEKGELVKDEY